MFKPRGRFRRRTKNYRRLPFRHVLVVSFVIFSFLTVVGLWMVNQGIQPTLMTIAQAKTENIATKIINTAINKQISEEYDFENFVEYTYDDNGNPSSVMINTGYTNKIASMAVIRAQEMLNRAEEGQLEDITLPEGVEFVRKDDSTIGMVYYIPLGLATNNALLSNLGPRVPVRFHVVGNVEQTIKEEEDEYGINNVHLKVSLVISAEISVTIPFETEPKQVTTAFTMVNTLVPGDVPLYYSDGGEGEPGIMLPPQNQEEEGSR